VRAAPVCKHERTVDRYLLNRTLSITIFFKRGAPVEAAVPEHTGTTQSSMKLLHLIAALATVIVGSLLLLHLSTSQRSGSRPYDDRLHSQYDVPSLLELIRVQNETIHTLEIHLKNTMMSKSDRLAEDAKLIEIADHLAQLSRENEQNRIRAASCHNMSHELEHNFDKALQQARLDAAAAVHCPEVTGTSEISVQPPSLAVTNGVVTYGVANKLWPTSQREDECEAKYGLELVNIWKKNEEMWCALPQGAADVESELKCYPYHQAHKKLDGRAPDLFCEATNFVIDFSKVSGDIANKGKPAKGSEYLTFGEGSLQSTCRKTASYQSRLFMPHFGKQVLPFTECVAGQFFQTPQRHVKALTRICGCLIQMNSFQPGAASLEHDSVVDTTTYLLARDEDCENSFHSTADFVS
jgi:hypothetical protein